MSDGFAFDLFLVAALSLGFIQGAYLNDIFHAAHVDVPIGQIEAAHTYGMTPWQTLMRSGFRPRRGLRCRRR